MREHEAKKVLKAYDIPVTQEALVHSVDEAWTWAEQIGETKGSGLVSCCCQGSNARNKT